jgi:hypothetical protein
MLELGRPFTSVRAPGTASPSPIGSAPPFCTSSGRGLHGHGYSSRRPALLQEQAPLHLPAQEFPKCSRCLDPSLVASLCSCAASSARARDPWSSSLSVFPGRAQVSAGDHCPCAAGRRSSLLCPCHPRPSAWAELAELLHRSVPPHLQQQPHGSPLCRAQGVLDILQQQQRHPPLRRARQIRPNAVDLCSVCASLLKSAVSSSLSRTPRFSKYQINKMCI